MALGRRGGRCAAAAKATRLDIRNSLQSSTPGSSTLRFGLGSTLLIVVEVMLSVGFLAIGVRGCGARGVLR